MRTLAVLFVVLAVTAVGLFATRSRPVAYAFVESGDPVGEPVLSVLNPFRNRAPERAAESVLEDLKRNDYARALSKIGDPKAPKADIAARENESRLRSWRLMNRTDSGASSKLFYQTKRGRRGSPDSPLWMTVERTHDGWKVKSYEAWY
jgi:hypothetical protein